MDESSIFPLSSKQENATTEITSEVKIEMVAPKYAVSNEKYINLKSVVKRLEETVVSLQKIILELTEN